MSQIEKKTHSNYHRGEAKCSMGPTLPYVGECTKGHKSHKLTITIR